MHVAVVFVTFLVTLFMLLALRPVAAVVGLVDVPGGHKTHDGPVPVIGGVCMSIGVGLGTALLARPSFWSPVLLGIYLLVIVGVLDDRFDLSPQIRFVAQGLAAVIVVYAADIQVTSLGSPLFFPAPLGVFSVPFTLVFIMTLINAFNFADGIDGLAGGLALTSLISMAVLGVGTNLFPVTLLLIGAVAAFLVVNFPFRFVKRIRTFMGDAGSTFLGLSVAAIGIALSQGAVPERSPVIGLWLVAVPVFELFCSIIRRVNDRKSPLAPDHGHLHHVLIAAGLSRGATLVVILTLAAACAVVGLVGSVLRVPDGVMLMAWFAAGTAYYRLLRRPAALLEAWLTLRALSARSKVQSAPP